MINVAFSEEFTGLAPDYRMLQLEADVTGGDTPTALTDEINRFAESMQQVMEIADINRRPGIAATRAAYKRFGKDPNRYRPSQEQMSRRILKQLGLYVVNNLADAGNLLSLKCGCSLGVFDRDKIAGDTITLGRGLHDEPYTGIGRGDLNIENLPVIRDAAGGIGTPTSDNIRTAVDSSTKRILITVNIYGDADMSDADIDAEARRLLTDYCSATGITSRIVRAAGD
ncbi:MAG: hypothetical protein K2L55_07075 [Muribaculaceae bacterium]|nr:hypothetical protein [Muribaculaceae bacterium]